VPGTLVAEREAVLTKKLQCEGHAALGELPGVTIVSAGSTVDEGSFRPFRVAVVSPPSAPSPPPPPPPPSPTVRAHPVTLQQAILNPNALGLLSIRAWRLPNPEFCDTPLLCTACFS
jgi:hypothetical protein